VARLRESLHDTTLAPAMLSRAIEGRLRGPAGSSVPVAVLDADGKALRFDLTRIDPPGTVAKFGNLPPMPVTFERRLIGGDVGYITFSIFLDPPRVMGEFTKAMAEFKGTRGLVIDLRGNPGGLGVMAMGIGGWFVTTPGSRLGAMTTRDSTLNFVLNPRATPYTKPLAILIDPLSASTSEVLAGGLKDLGRARVFGETSAGAALPSQIVRLPSGDGFQFAVANYVSTGGQELEGRGVMPDVVAPPTREALLQGRDPALDAALEWIRSQ
jgi:carboxyl-terminal processing protease